MRLAIGDDLPDGQLEIALLDAEGARKGTALIRELSKQSDDGPDNETVYCTSHTAPPPHTHTHINT